jgi:hypothetical protein
MRSARGSTSGGSPGLQKGIDVNDRLDLPPALIAEAKTKPGGWVYEIVGDYGPDDAVPPTAIRGAWKVGDDGEIVGDFLPNPVFEPSAG